MKRIHPSPWALAAVAWFAMASPGEALATFYELSWAYKWGQGDIVFDGSVPDSNPSPDQGDYFGAIVSYDLLAFAEGGDAIPLAGSTGSISVQNQGPGTLAALTFQLGSAAPPYDPAGWFLTFTVPPELGNFFDHLPTELLEPGPCGSGPDTCNEFTSYSLAGTIGRNTPNGQTFIPITDQGGPAVTFKAIVSPTAPVPEPATAVLLGLGLAVLAAANRKRLR